MKREHFNLSLFFLIIMLVSSCRPGSISLQLHPPDKSEYNLLFKTKGKVSITVAGKAFSTDVQTGISSFLKADTLGNNSYQFALTYDDFDMQQQVDGRITDLKKLPADSNLKHGINFIRGITFISKVNATGKSVEMMKRDSIMPGLDSLLAGRPEQEKKQVISVIQPLLSSDMARGMLDQCFYVFPDHKVNIGDSWKNEIVMQSIFSMVMKTKFTLEAIKDNIALLKVHSDITPYKNEVMMPGLAMNSPKISDPNPQPGGMDIMGMKLIAQFEGTQDGNVWIDMSSGMVQQNMLTQDLKGKVSVSIIDLPMTMKMETGYSIHKIK